MSVVSLKRRFPLQTIRSMFHPGVLLLAWAAAIVGMQVLTLATLGATLGAMLLLVGPGARIRWLLLARRSRLLLLVIVVTFTLATPGEAVLPGYPVTYEGIAQGVEQLARFLAILGAVAWLLDRLPMPQLIAGLVALSRPLATLGIDTRRAAARLVLVLEHVEHGRFADWRAAFDDNVEPPPRRIEIERPRLRRADAVLVGAVLVMTLLMVSL